MGAAIKELTVEGFKSIRKLEKFELRNLNVLIGANGAGKSNFVEVFRLLRTLADRNIHDYVVKGGGSDGFFFDGPKSTPRINFGISFGSNHWEFALEPTADGRVTLSNEVVRNDKGVVPNWEKIVGIFVETKLAFASDAAELVSVQSVPREIHATIKSWGIYHFHDTSSLSPMRRDQSIEDTEYLRPDASNIAAFLLHLRAHHAAAYNLIRDTIRLVAPFFNDFLLKPRQFGPETKVALDWHQKSSDFPFQPWHLSDGTLRFICLATALLQPDPPSTIVIDEPELGLHPHALEVLAGLLQRASQRTQVIVSTQSAPLLSQFEPEDVITVCRKDGASVFGRLDRKDLADWMKDYTLGELWQKNVVEAGASDD